MSHVKWKKPDPWRALNRHGPEKPSGSWQSSTPDRCACCLSLHEGHPVTAWEAAYLVCHLLLREEVTELNPSIPRRPVGRFYIPKEIVDPSGSQTHWRICETQDKLNLSDGVILRKLA